MNSGIHWSREEALQAGAVVSVTNVAFEAGIFYDTAVTAAVWNRCVTVPPCVSWQSEEGRLFDLIWKLRLAIEEHKCRSDLVEFELDVQNDADGSQRVKLQAICEPAGYITVLLPEEG